MIATVRRRFVIAAVSLIWIVAVAATGAFAGDHASNDWRARVSEELPLLGHRNWIAVVDSAYPLQTSSGIETVETGSDQLEVVRQVLEELSKAKHVRPVIFTDAELKVVPESDAKGVTAYRSVYVGIHPSGMRILARRRREEVAPGDGGALRYSGPNDIRGGILARLDQFPAAARDTLHLVALGARAF